MPAFVGIDHPGRAYPGARGVLPPHVGLVDDELSPRLRELASTRMLDRARVLGAAMRVAYLLSGRDAGRAADDARCAVETRQVWSCDLPNGLAALAGERLFSRLKQLARLIGREPAISGFG